jgi:hypothetical protein
VLDAFAQTEGEPIERQRVRRRRRGAEGGGPGPHHHDLSHAGHGPARRGTETVGLDRDVAPPQDGQALLGGELSHAPLRLGGVVGVGGQEHQPHRVLTRVGEVEAPGSGEEPVWDLDQDAGTVPRGHLGAGGAPVRQVLQRGEPLADEPVAPPSSEIGHQGDAAGVVLEGRVVEGCAGVRRQTPRRCRVLGCRH